MIASGLFIVVLSILLLKLAELSGLITDNRQLVLATAFSIGVMLITGGVCTWLWENLP